MDLIKNYQLNLNIPSYIFVGRDNRSSGPKLLGDLLNGVKVVGDRVEIIDLGEITTPMLHFIVKYSNITCTRCNSFQWSDISPEMHKTIYCTHWLECYNNFLQQCQLQGPFSEELLVDVANGVGGSVYNTRLPFHLVNYSNNDMLNFKCGSDYVKLNNCFPTLMDSNNSHMNHTSNMDAAKRIASFDGDADRIVYSFLSNSGKVVVFDGDDMCCLFTYFIIDLLERANVPFNGISGEPNILSVGVVHTAYTNGGVIEFLQNFKNVNVTGVPTGVKHLHREAKKYDIGIYYESNGHGTILCDYARVMEKLKLTSTTFFQAQFPYDYFHQSNATCPDSMINEKFNDAAIEPQKIDYIEILINFLKLSNQAVGDSLTNLLMVEAVLKYYKIDFNTFTKKYTKLVTSLRSVKVNDKFSFVTSHNNEQNLMLPLNLQRFLNEITTENCSNKLRTFVRPSGTEDIVRIYVEANCQNVVDETFLSISAHIRDHNY